jgi:predicted N-acetyltransferase YhbS
VTAAPIAVYPLHWEADVLLADGGVAHLRPSGPADGAAIRALHDRSSAKTLYMRYFSAISTVSDRQIEFFTDVDYDSRVGLVAVLGGEIIAAGTYHRYTVGDTDAAEAAFLVEDSQQGRGLGSILGFADAGTSGETGAAAVGRAGPRCRDAGAGPELPGSRSPPTRPSACWSRSGSA